MDAILQNNIFRYISLNEIIVDFIELSFIYILLSLDDEKSTLFQIMG